MNTIKLLLFLTLFYSCEIYRDNDIPNGSNDDNIHELVVYEHFFGDLSKVKLSDFRYSAPQKILDSMAIYGINHFSDSETCNKFLKYYDSTFTSTGFDFKNYILIPVFISSLTLSSHTKSYSCNIKCYLNQKDKTARVVVISKYNKISDADLTHPTLLHYRKWVSVPILPSGFKLIVDKNII